MCVDRGLVPREGTSIASSAMAPRQIALADALGAAVRRKPYQVMFTLPDHVRDSQTCSCLSFVEKTLNEKRLHEQPESIITRVATNPEALFMAGY